MGMSSQVTLRGLLGLGDEPAALRDSALIMIDCQNTYRRGVMRLEGAEDAFNLGYRPTIVASATATRELPVPGSPPVPASTLQSATLAGIADLFALVVGQPDDLPG